MKTKTREDDWQARREAQRKAHEQAIREKIPLIDLREITRSSDRCRSRVTIEWDWDNRAVEWILFGEAQLRTQRDRPDGRWRLAAYVQAGVTDFEHDSAYAFRLPLIGVALDGIDYQETRLVAWIDPNDPEGFCIPEPGYNPMKHPEAHMCKECKPNHIIVPEGNYVPKQNLKLYELVRGKKIEIRIGTVIPDDKDG